MELPFGLNPYENDPGAWGASLVNNAEVMLGCLDAANARAVIEVGAYAGDLTRLLLRWAEGSGARVIAVDPFPQPQLEELARDRADLELIRETSLEALPVIAPADAVVIDGDHNYYTVTQELERIERRWADQGEALPLLLVHDVCWPHGRRDDYYDPDQIPEDQRRPIGVGGGLYPGIAGLRPGGLPYRHPAAEEGGPRNGVLTALEDFVSARADLRLIVFPAFFGLGIVFPAPAAYAAELQAQLAPFDRHPLLERLERNRVLHLASSHVQLRLAMDAEAKLARHNALFEEMLGSRVFALAELYLRLRQRGRPSFSRSAIRRVMHGD